MNNNIIVFSCGYNCVDYVQDHISSIDLQTYGEYTHVIVDDGSTDGTYEQLMDYKKTTDRKVDLIHFVDNKGSNILSHIIGLKPKDTDIVVRVDLDDSLTDPFVLQYIIDIYNETDCWLTHGSFRRLSNNTIQGAPYPDRIKKNKQYREYSRWLCQHLRTFKGFLFNNIDQNDLLDANGEYPIGADDLALTFPMLEMSPPDKVIHIPDILYNYNDLNPLNECKIKASDVQKNTQWFRSKNKYKELKR